MEVVRLRGNACGAYQHPRMTMGTTCRQTSSQKRGDLAHLVCPKLQGGSCEHAVLLRHDTPAGHQCQASVSDRSYPESRPGFVTPALPPRPLTLCCLRHGDGADERGHGAHQHVLGQLQSVSLPAVPGLPADGRCASCLPSSPCAVRVQAYPFPRASSCGITAASRAQILACSAVASTCLCGNQTAMIHHNAHIEAAMSGERVRAVWRVSRRL